MNISILHETDDLLVINKPSGLMVHSDGKTKKLTLADWVLEHYPLLKGVGEPMLIEGETLDRPGIVHRLDEETSGCLILAKTQESFLSLKSQFQNRIIKKQYHAFVWGHFKESAGIVDASIGRNKNDFRKWHAGRGSRGELRDAVTHWQVKEMFFDENEEKFSLVYLFPLTGRTHQLRVHMQYLQRPIVADRLYGESKPDALGFTRVALHARTVTFQDISGKTHTITAPYEVDFASAIAKYSPV